MRQMDHCRPASTNSISRWYVAGAPVNPNGMKRNSWRPYLLQKAVFGISFSAIGTWQYADKKSVTEYTVDPASALMESSILGIGSAFEFRVRLFSLLKSTHGQTSPVFFLTITKGEAHGEVDGHIPPCLVNFSIALRSSPAKANGIPRGGCFTGLESPVSIVCSTKLVHPISNSSLAKTF